MKKNGLPLYKNRHLIRSNIKTIRCYLEMDKTEFGEVTGIGKRSIEIETRLSATLEELVKIADYAEIQVDWIVKHRLYMTLNVSV